MRKYIIRKCDRCCPDGGACCDYTWDDDGRPAWKCRNCHNVMPRRVMKREAAEPNKRQARLIARIVEIWGGTVETKMIGRKVWITCRNDRRNWISGDTVHGTIGPRGKLDLTLMRVGGDKKINSLASLTT